MQNPLNTICIVGGGTAGWMAATLLAAALQGNKLSITLVESPDIPTIGVGESTVPSIMEFLRVCNINLQDFVQATSASFKLGIQFKDWCAPGAAFFHPFGAVGQGFQGFDFYQVFLKAAALDSTQQWLDYSPAAVMAQQQRFMLRPAQAQSWALQHYSYALHLDASLAATYLRNHALARGVNRIEASVQRVAVDEGGIAQLELNNGQSIKSDFYIDCTGFNSLLMAGALQVGYDHWNHYLPCDRAVALQTRSTEAPPPYTQATARAAGWTWKIPLQRRTGNGYVFASQFCSDDEAIGTLCGAVTGVHLNEPRIIPFVTGKRKKIWHKNCLALGLAAGFVEPLESTAIHLVYKTLIRFIADFPDADCDPYTEAAFNQKITRDYEEIRDFIILHYCTSQRTDSEFWRWCKAMPIPETLQEHLAIFHQRGQLHHTNEQFFSKDSWYSVLEGMQQRPKKYHPLVDGFKQHWLIDMLQTQRQHIATSVSAMPKHQEFLQQHCPARGSLTQPFF